MAFNLADLNNDEYRGELTKLPTAQFLLTNGTLKNTGFENFSPILFLKDSSVKLANFKSDAYGKEYAHQFRTGNNGPEKGLAFSKFSMNILAVSPRFIELTKKGQDEGYGERGQIIGNFDDSHGSTVRASLPKECTTLRTIYMVMLVAPNGDFLHRMPIAISVKGGAAAVLGNALADFYVSLGSSYSDSKYGNGGITSFSTEAKALGIFKCTLGIEAVGEGELKSDVPCVESYEIPTPEDIDRFFNTKNADIIFEMIKSIKGFDHRYFKQFEQFHAIAPAKGQEGQANNNVLSFAQDSPAFAAEKNVQEFGNLPF